MEVRGRLGAKYRRLWSAAAISYLGDGLILAAMQLLAESSTKTAVLVSGIVAMRYGAWLLLGLLGGVVADRADRQRVMVYVDLARTVAVGLLGVVVLWGSARPPIAMLWLTVFLLGCGEVFFDSASEAMLPNVVSDATLLERANSRLFVTQSITTELIGPPLGAFLFTAAAALPFLLDAWSFLSSAMIMLTIHGSYRARSTTLFDDLDASSDEFTTRRQTVRADIAEGWRFVRQHRLLRSLIVLGCAWNFFAIGAESTNVLFARRELHISRGAFGLVLTGFAVGGILAGALTERIVQRFGPGHTILTTFLLGSAAGLLSAASQNAIVFTIGFAMSFAAGTAASIVVVTLRQQLVPDALRGRVTSFFRVGIFAAAATGALTMGVLAQTVSLRAPLVALGIAGFALFLSALGEINNRTIAAARA